MSTDLTLALQLAVDVDQWPTVGQLIPVVYSPKNPDNWRFAPSQVPDHPGELS